MIKETLNNGIKSTQNVNEKKKGDPWNINNFCKHFFIDLLVICGITYLMNLGQFLNKDLKFNWNPVSFNYTSQNQYEFAVVADLDMNSRDTREFIWRSYLKRGTLKRIKKEGKNLYRIYWGDTIAIESQTATKNRSMELSDLINWQGNLLAACDYTGIVYRISPEGKVYQRFALADGNGKESKPFKTEWMTTKQDKLYIGSIGKEWVVNGKPIHKNPFWVKVIDSSGTIYSENWEDRYTSLRKATNTEYPGYLIHEAVVYHPNFQKWIFLPRRESTDPYDPISEELKGTNLLIIADEDINVAPVVKRIGMIEPEWGYSSVKVIPDTGEFIAIKVYEVDGITKTKLTIFDIDGNFLLESDDNDDPWSIVSDDIKFEGIEFL